MNFWQGKICPVCKNELNENDDIVYCPDCGTAHHRKCWKETGKCWFAQEHENGNFDTTNEMVTRETMVEQQTTDTSTCVCPACGAQNPPGFRVCMNCGKELTNTENSGSQNAMHPHQHLNADSKNVPFFSSPLMNFTDIPQDEKVDDSEIVEGIVTKNDVIQFCRTDGIRYAELLMKVRDKKIVFMPMAFLFSFFWLLYRKMAKIGLLLSVIVFAPIFVFSSMLVSKYSDQINALSQSVGTSDYNQQAMSLIDKAMTQMPHVQLLMAAFWGILLAAMLFCGFYGLRIYYRKVINDITKIKQNIPNKYQRNLFYAQRGNISAMYPFLAIVLFWLISNVIGYLFL